MIYFTSDIHHRHKRICEITDRHKVTDQEHHDEWLIELWNSQVTKQDIVYHLGDFSFASKYEDVAAFTTRLNGAIFLMKGNHDKTDNLNKLKSNNLIQHWYDYKEIQIKGITTCMFHFPISSWHKQHYGSFHLHGHCVDMETEVLTDSGWLKRCNIKVGDTVISYNTNTKQLEYDSILNVTDLNYSGGVVVGDSRSHDFVVTDDHTMITMATGKLEISKVLAKDLKNKSRRRLITSGINKENKGLGLTKEMLQLHIVCTADGSIKKNTNLCRIVVKKEHKIKFLKTLFSHLGLEHKVYNRGSYTSFNFYLPVELQNLPFKGLGNYLLNSNEVDAATIFESYANSDGHKPKNNNTLIIYSAKECEIDILQAMFCQNGYHTNKHSRNHGFGKNTQYQLSVTKKSVMSLSTDKIRFEEVENKHFWCIKTRNSTWVMRRNGVVQITGNSHGNHSGNGKLLDVGLDSAYNILGEHRLFTQDEVYEILSNKSVTINDSHRKEKTA